MSGPTKPDLLHAISDSTKRWGSILYPAASNGSIIAETGTQRISAYTLLREVETAILWGYSSVLSHTERRSISGTSGQSSSVRGLLERTQRELGFNTSMAFPTASAKPASNPPSTRLCAFPPSINLFRLCSVYYTLQAPSTLSLS